MLEQESNLNKFSIIKNILYSFEVYNGLMDYEKAMNIMNSSVNEVLYNNQRQKILFFEHEDVYTAGRMALDSSDIINKDLNIIYTDRGGKLTYHGPGQRVLYPILDLNKFQRDIKKYVSFLQDLIINTLDVIGIKSHVDKAGVGIWTIQDNDLYKVASIGIKVRKWIAYHGIAVNIFTDLNKFNQIIPCGIKDYKHISIQKLGINIEFEEFDKILINEFNNLIRSIE